MELFDKFNFNDDNFNLETILIMNDLLLAGIVEIANNVGIYLDMNYLRCEYFDRAVKCKKFIDTKKMDDDSLFNEIPAMKNIICKILDMNKNKEGD